MDYKDLRMRDRHRGEKKGVRRRLPTVGSHFSLTPSLKSIETVQIDLFSVSQLSHHQAFCLIHIMKTVNCCCSCGFSHRVPASRFAKAPATPSSPKLKLCKEEKCLSRNRRHGRSGTRTQASRLDSQREVRSWDGSSQTFTFHKAKIQFVAHFCPESSAAMCQPRGSHTRKVTLQRRHSA